MVRKVKWWQWYCYYRDRWNSGCCVPVEIGMWIQSREDIVSSLIQHCISNNTQISMQPTLYTWYQTLSRLLYWPLSKQRDGGYHWQCLHLVIHSRGPHGFKLLSISDDISPCGFVNGRNLTPPSSQFGYHTVEFINPFIFSPLLVSFRYSEDLDRPMTPFVHQRIAWRQVRSTSTDWLFTSVSHVLVTG